LHTQVDQAIAKALQQLCDKHSELVASRASIKSEASIAANLALEEPESASMMDVRVTR